MDTTDWDIASKPVVDAGMSRRDGQAHLGQAIFNAINTKTTLIGQAPTGTGKSVAAAIPLITKVLEAKKLDQKFRGAISTETITLQNQIAGKDLPFLQKLYPGFIFKKLMGRNNYLCLDTAGISSMGDYSIEIVYQKLLKRQDDLGAGEIADVERILGHEVDADLWKKIQGDQNFCVDNDCQPESCYAARARAEALDADIVVVNHALLGIDAELKARGDMFSEGVLGTLNTIIVDEAHALEPVLVNQWTEELTHWQISNYIDATFYTVNRCIQIKGPVHMLDTVQNAGEMIFDAFNNIQTFFEHLVNETNGEWSKFESPVSLKYLPGSSSTSLIHLLNKYEIDTPKLIKKAIDHLYAVDSYMMQIWGYLSELAVKIKQRRKFNKGFRAIKELIKILTMLGKSLVTKDGIIDNYGKTGVIFQGWVSKKDMTNKMTMRMVPLDVSAKASTIWKNVSSAVLISATLVDLTDGTFNYSRRCVGFPNGPEIDVTSPFDYQTKQLIYKTIAKGPRVENAQYSLGELLALIKAVNGRSLILFTAKSELEYAAEELRKLRHQKKFDYQILVQEDGANKQKLLEEFKSDTHSVLLGLKSFFVGVDVPGEALSHVAICKFPLARYSAECKMRIVVWREKGFPRWYERESLTTLAQAAGRLIRSTDDHGVISILDYRITNPKENVYSTAQTGINALGSPVTQSVAEVEAFLASHVQQPLSIV